MSSPIRADPHHRIRYKRKKRRYINLTQSPIGKITSTYQYLDDETRKTKRKLTELEESADLHRAIYHSNEGLVVSLLSSGLNANARNDHRDIPIHIAAAKGHLDIFKCLVEHKANINVCNEQGRTSLHLVAEYGHSESQHLELANYIIQRCNDINAVDTYKQTALHLAVKSNNLEITRLLLESDAIVDIADDEGKTALHLAIIKKSSQLVDMLLSWDADPRIKCQNGFSSLYYAIRGGCNSIVESILEHGVDINDKVSNNSGFSATMCRPSLHMAIERNNVALVEMLLDRKVDIHGEDQLGNGPLHVAVRCGRDQIVKLLLSRGARLNQIDKRGVNSLYVALENGRDRILELLMNHGATMNDRGKAGHSLLHSAIKNRNINVFRILLLKDMISLDVVDHLGKTPLHYAVEDKNLSFSTLLLEHGANVNVKDILGKTALHLAIETGRQPIYQVLVQHRADVNAGDNNLRTPLHFAVLKGCAMATELLLTHGANVNAKNCNGETALHFAVQFGYMQLFDLFVKHKVDLEVADDIGHTPLHSTIIHENSKLRYCPMEETFFWNLLDRDVNLQAKEYASGHTPLHLSVKQGCTEFTKYLLLHGADVNEVDKEGKTPLHVAVEAGYDECIEQLLLHNASVKKKDNNDKVPMELASREHVQGVFDRHRIKKAIAGFRVNHLGYLNALCEDRANAFWEPCTAEIERMKLAKIYVDVTYYDYLRGSARILINFARKEEVVAIFEQGNHKTLFPIYADMLERNYEIGKRFEPFMNEAIVRMYILSRFRLNDVPVEKIVGYLSLRELKQFVQAVPKARPLEEK